MDYLATQEPAVLTYRKSDMVLAVHSDASYLNEEEARSRAGGHHFLSEDIPLPPNNGVIHNIAEIIKGVMSSAAKAELGAMYINSRKAVEERIILEEMGHKQPATPVQVDNSTAEGIINKRVQPKRTHGYAFPLATRSQHQPEIISILLAPRPHKFSRLLGEASSSSAP